jgi:bifunctional non-homologous end joining protein LigD
MHGEPRKGKVIVDWSQNDQYKSTIAPCSLRAKTSRSTVATPITWDELTDALDAGTPERLMFGPDQVIDRIGRIGDLHATSRDLRPAPAET